MVYRRRERPGGGPAARRLFTYSIFYLFALFAALLLEHAAGMGLMSDIGAARRASSLTEEQKRRRRMRSLAIGWGLGALAVLFFLVTLVRLGANVASRAL